MIGFTEDIQEKDLEPPFDGLNGEYVTIHTRTQSYTGRISEIKEGFVYLSPFQTGRHNPEKGPEFFLSDKDMRVKIEELMTVIPTTKESVEGYCEYQNKENQEERISKERQRKSGLEEASKKSDQNTR